MVIGDKGPAVLPLGVADAVAVADGDPGALEHRLAGAREFLLEPGDHLRGLRLVRPVIDAVVVGQGHIEGVQARGEAGRTEIRRAFGRIRIVEAPEVLHPRRVPGTLVVRRRVLFGRLLPHPEHRRRDVGLPWVAGVAQSRQGRRIHPRRRQGRQRGSRRAGAALEGGNTGGGGDLGHRLRHGRRAPGRQQEQQ